MTVQENKFSMRFYDQHNTIITSAPHISRLPVQLSIIGNRLNTETGPTTLSQIGKKIKCGYKLPENILILEWGDPKTIISSS